MLQAATELCWLTCACSRLNAEELTRAGGLRLLGGLLVRCIAVVPADVAPHQPAAVIATHALRALAAMAAFENARAQLEQPQSQQLVSDIGGLLHLLGFGSSWHGAQPCKGGQSRSCPAVQRAVSAVVYKSAACSFAIQRCLPCHLSSSQLILLHPDCLCHAAKPAVNAVQCAAAASSAPRLPWKPPCCAWRDAVQAADCRLVLLLPYLPWYVAAHCCLGLWGTMAAA